jgi:hypothetical protein
MIAFLLTAVAALELTASDYAAKTEGKSAFIKFLAPW